MTTLAAPRRRPSMGRVFLFSLLVGAGAVLAIAWVEHVPRPVAQAPFRARPLSPGIAVTAQLEPGQMSAIASRYRTVVDIRPDGEDAGQPSSDAMRDAATRAGLGFDYVPVPHGDIPEAAVRRLAGAMSANQGQVLLYCRSGRRAARTWALAEAERPGGWPADRILAAVKEAGQDAQDLRPRIEAAIAARGAAR